MNKPHRDHDALSAEHRQEEYVRLLNEHRNILFNYIFCVVQTLPDTEDVFQQTTLAMWDSFDQFQPGTDFQAWGIRIARNRALNFIRSRRRERVYFSHKIIDQLAETVRESPEIQEERLRALASCREKLPATDRTLLELCYGRCNTIREAAAEIGRPIGAVYESLWRIRRALHSCIQKKLARNGT